jgi:hypothetical protein
MLKNYRYFKVHLPLTLFFLIAFNCFITNVFAQKDTSLIRLEKMLEKEYDVVKKLKINEQLIEKANFYYRDLFKEYIEKGIFLAEQSRDRNLMIEARRTATKYLLVGQDDISRATAKKYTLEALAISKQDGVSFKEKVAVNMQLAAVERTLGNATEGLKYNQDAFDIASSSGIDSLKIISLVGYGNTQLFLNENLKAFKNYTTALEIAEKCDEAYGPDLVNNVYNGLINFYTSIENYDKAIDYQYKQLNYYKAKKEVNRIIETLDAIGTSYGRNKNVNAAKRTFAEVIRLADSLKNSDYKISANVGILNAIAEGDNKLEGITFLQAHPEIRALYEKGGVGYMLDFGMGNFFSRIGKYDSADYYYNKSYDQMLQRGSVFQKISAYQNYGYHLYLSGNYNKAIANLLNGKTLTDSTKNLDNRLKFLEYLDSCYQKIGDYKNAFMYNSLASKLKIEIEEKRKEKDLLALEINSEEKRKERLRIEEIENTTKRHNWQYMAIIVAITTLFIFLAAFGVLNVPLKWVRALGFISFIFLFEFIILLADNKIHHATHGEPWKVLLIKVVLIAMLMPIHHWLEHKVVNFITTRRNNSTNSILKT